MPTYVYKCKTCNESWEESLSYEMRDKPVEEGYGECTVTTPCEGEVVRVPAMPGFAYDNISSPGHLKKTPGWMKDKLKTIKKEQPLATMSVPD